MKKITAILAAIMLSAACLAGGVVEISRSGTQTCGVSATGMTFTNTFGGSFGYQLLEVDVWAWTTMQTNITAEIIIKAIEGGSGVTNKLATLTNSVASVTAAATNVTACFIFSESSVSVPCVFAAGDIIVLQCATSQTFSASVKRKQFMRQ